MSLTEKQKTDYERDGFVIYGPFVVGGNTSSLA